MAKHEKAEVVMLAGRLWPNTRWGSAMEIEVFGATGEFATGKTILGLSIAPGVHPTGHPFAGQPRTLYLDLEKSGATYGGTGCQRIDVPATLAKAYGANYTARQMAEWFNALPAKLQPGQFDVIVVDPVNDIESGEVDIVKANPAAHGYTANQFAGSVGLLMAAMKAHWKKLLMGYSNVCKCFFFTTHLRDEFKGGRPSGKREPRGKETLAELASLYLWLERAPDEKGVVSDKPSAIVLKQRLADTRMNADGELEIVNLMPPRIPVATVQAIRQYIANPPDYNKLTAGERVVEKPVTEIELQRMRLATAEAQTAAATAQATVLDRQRELTAIRQAACACSPQQADQTARLNKEAAEKREADAAVAAAAATEKLAAQVEEGKRLAAAAGPEHATTQHVHDQQKALAAMEQARTGVATPSANGDRVERFKRLLPASGVDLDKLKLAFSLRNAERFTQLRPSDQDEILAWLDDVAACQNLIELLGLDDTKVKQLCARASVQQIADLNGPLAVALRATLQKTLDARQHQPKN